MKLSCNVARDLLPLYHDGVCSDESRVLVEEHVRECADCGGILKELRGGIEVSVESADDLAPLEKIEKNVKKGRKKAWMKGVAAALAVLLVIFAGVNVWWYAGTYSHYQQFAEGYEPLEENGVDPQGNTVVIYEVDESGKVLGPVNEVQEVYCWYVDGYQFLVVMPTYLSGQGIVEVCTSMENTTRSVSIGKQAELILDIGKDGLYRVTLSITEHTQGGQAQLQVTHTTERVTLDADLNQVCQDNWDEETIAHQDAIYEEYHAEIIRIIQAAQAQWPFLEE